MEITSTLLIHCFSSCFGNRLDPFHQSAYRACAFINFGHFVPKNSPFGGIIVAVATFPRSSPSTSLHVYYFLSHWFWNERIRKVDFHSFIRCDWKQMWRIPRTINAPEKTRFKYSCEFRQTVEFTIDFNYFFFTVNDSLRQIFFAREYLTNANNSNEHLKICGIQ